MSKVKLMIEIDKDKYRLITEMPNVYASELCEAIRNGTPYNPQGEWVRKEDVIHSIAKQYSEHNELVPIWLRIGDMKGGDSECHGEQ